MAPYPCEVPGQERMYLRELAKKYMEYASLPVMQARELMWRRLNDLRGTVPPILMEIETFEDDLLPPSRCTGETGKMIEKALLKGIVNHELVDDDKVIPSYFTIHWNITYKMFGITVERTRIKDSRGKKLALKMNHPVKDVAGDLESVLGSSVMALYRKHTVALKETVEEVLGDIMPVKIKGPMILGNIPDQIFPLMGLETMLFAFADHPERMHKLFGRIRDERIAQIRWYESERLLTVSNENEQIPSGGYAFTNQLPASDRAQREFVASRDTWGHLSAQELSAVSPDMYGEFLFPHYRELGKEFGLVHYGCCEPVHEIWHRYVSKIPNMRSVSITRWCDEHIMAEALRGQNMIYCRKPDPTFVGVGAFDEDAFSRHSSRTLEIARGCHLEFVFRDIYTLVGEKDRAGRAVRIVREMIDRYW